jgi:hypothetical protein
VLADWTRWLANSRAIFVAHLHTPAQMAGNAKRPVFSVARAILRPMPSRPITFSAGTKTSVYRVWEFSIPRSPMNSQRASTTTPSVPLGTIKAVIPPL